MVAWLEWLVWFLDAVWQGTTRALRLDPALLRFAESHREVTGVILAVAVLAGISQLLGQSVTLFVNRVPPRQFVLSLLLNGVLFAANLVIWALTVWAVARYGLRLDVQAGAMLRLILLSSAPYVFGFFILIPYLGTAISKLLAVWSLIISVNAIMFSLNISLVIALLCIGLGWLLSQLLSATVGRPIIALRDWLLRTTAGGALTQRAEDILATFQAEAHPTPPKGEQP
jgi:hypothetical protein